VHTIGSIIYYPQRFGIVQSPDTAGKLFQIFSYPSSLQLSAIITAIGMIISTYEIVFFARHTPLLFVEIFGTTMDHHTTAVGVPNIITRPPSFMHLSRQVRFFTVDLTTFQTLPVPI